MEERRHEFWQETARYPEICAYTQAAIITTIIIHQHPFLNLTVYSLMDYEHISNRLEQEKITYK